MAVDPDAVDVMAHLVADIYREAELALIRRTAAAINDGLARQRLEDVQALRRAAEAITTKLATDADPLIRQQLAAAYRHGWGSALADLPEQWDPASGIGQAAREAAKQRSGTAFVETLASSLVRDVGVASSNILRNVEDAYKRVQAAASARILTGAQTRREAAQAMWQGLVDRGLTSFTDKSGRRWRLSSYVEMATRTNAQRAAITGQVDRLDTIGVNLVFVSDSPQECKVCRPFEGEILRTDPGPLTVQIEHATKDGVMVDVTAYDTLDGARAKGFQHPNCRHSVSAYLPGVSKPPTNTADPDGDVARQKQRALERKIRAAKEQEEAALTPDARKAAAKKTRAAQAQLRQHLADNPKLKRLRYREQPGAGNIPPAGKNDPAGTLAPIDPPKPPAPAPAPAPAPPAPAAPPMPPGMRDGYRAYDDGEGVEWAHREMPLSPDITDAERDAVVAYTGPAYGPINRHLRDGKPATPQIQLIDDAFARSRAPEPIIVHRGVGEPFIEYLGASLADVASMKALVGTVFTEASYLSTSIGSTAAFSSMAVRMMIRLPKGHGAMNVISISKYPGEREILVERGTNLLVHAVYQRGGQWYIEAEAVPDGWNPTAGWSPDPYGDAEDGYLF